MIVLLFCPFVCQHVPLMKFEAFASFTGQVEKWDTSLKGILFFEIS